GARPLVAHDGLFGGRGPMTIDPILKRRLQTLFDADVGLAAYPLPLDAHQTLGNNARIAAALGLSVEGWFSDSAGAPLAVHGSLPQAMTADALASLLAEATGRPPPVFPRGPDRLPRPGGRGRRARGSPPGARAAA